tara:strand:+ start:305 stop:2953 length:2649 start_codon:yes stop_codon:yes gene_type:complete
MKSSEIEKALKNLTTHITPESFLFELLSIYDFPKASITRLKKGDGNLSKNEGEFLSKNKFLFKSIEDIDPHLVIDELGVNETLLKYRPRFLIVTNYKTFLAQDLKTYDSLDIPIEMLADNHEFFLPWMGIEKSKLVNESIVDVKAATKMGQLYDLILANNSNFVTDKDKKHALNIFFAQLLFCLFAEDTALFEDNIFTNSIATYSNEDGSDLNKILSNIFKSLDAKDKTNFPAYCRDLPYVGGDLFQGDFNLPIFSRKARVNIIEAGKLDWREVNPDIFGSMIQVISTPEDRSSLGEHYTSVSNIMKVINPLFMDLFNEQFDRCKSEKDYEKLLKRIYSIKIFDPASGSGNFLIVTYKQLCQLEFKIFSALQEINSLKWTLASLGIRSSQFYALTIQDFDAQIAKLSMYITEHQMHRELSDIFGEVSPTLPFSNTLNIKVTNSLHEDWKIFLNAGDEEIFIIGNPPYVGSSMQNNAQKNDMNFVLGNYSNYKNLDYIACWFEKGSQFISKTSNSSMALVSTNSITQGEQVDLLWPNIDKLGVSINFAYHSFKWKNNAQHNAGVTCCILGLAKKNNKPKYIYDSAGLKIKASNINPYLIDDDFVTIKRMGKPLSNIPEMRKGNMPTDGGNLILNNNEYYELINNYPESKKLLKKYIGANELIQRIHLWCLWITDEQKKLAESIPPIKIRIEKVRELRLASRAPSTRQKANISHRFIQIQSEPKSALLVPTISSERREYIPIEFITDDTVCSGQTLAIFDSPTYLFSVLSSSLHNLWVKTVGGRMRTDIRYSSLCYNSFAIPNINEEHEDLLTKISFTIMDIREKYSDQTFAQLYDPKKMPIDLKQVHLENDKVVDKIVLGKNGLSDEERLSILFKIYREMEKK